jgi:hypothetical protein
MKIKYILPAFFIGKFASDTIDASINKYASKNAQTLIDNLFSWKSVVSLRLGSILLLPFIYKRANVSSNEEIRA